MSLAEVSSTLLAEVSSTPQSEEPLAILPKVVTPSTPPARAHTVFDFSPKHPHLPPLATSTSVKPPTFAKPPTPKGVLLSAVLNSVVASGGVDTVPKQGGGVGGEKRKMEGSLLPAAKRISKMPSSSFTSSTTTKRVPSSSTSNSTKTSLSGVQKEDPDWVPPTPSSSAKVNIYK